VRWYDLARTEVNEGIDTIPTSRLCSAHRYHACTSVPIMTVAATPQSVLNLATEVANAARRLPLDGLTVVTGGNISARDPETGLIVITPAGAPYRDMSASDIVVVDETGQVVYGSRPPSSEMAMHLELMRRA